MTQNKGKTQRYRPVSHKGKRIKKPLKIHI